MPENKNTVCVNSAQCWSQVFIFCLSSRKSSGDVTEECPESELTAKQRSEDLTGKGNRALSGSGDDTKDLDDITCKKVDDHQMDCCFFTTTQSYLHRIYYCGCFYS